MKAITENLQLSGVYMLINTSNGKKYIGSSINIRQRLWRHRSDLRHNCHENKHLQNAWNKYGENAFEYCLLEVCNPEIRISREQYFIDTLNPEYNLCLNAETYEFQEDSKKKLSETRKRLMKEGIISITNNKPVWVYYKDGSFVGKWESVRKAAAALNIHYSSACRVIQNKDTQTNGYRFYLSEQTKVLPFKKPTNSSKISVDYIVDDGISKKHCKGQKAVAKYLNTTREIVNQCIIHKKPYKKKYMIYKSLPCE